MIKSDIVNINDKNLSMTNQPQNESIKKNIKKNKNDDIILINFENDNVSEKKDLELDETKENTSPDEVPTKIEKKYKQKDKDNIIIITTPQLKSLLKLCKSKSNRVSKEISPKVNQYFIEIILPEF